MAAGVAGSAPQRVGALVVRRRSGVLHRYPPPWSVSRARAERKRWMRGESAAPVEEAGEEAGPRDALGLRHAVTAPQPTAPARAAWQRDRANARWLGRAAGWRLCCASECEDAAIGRQSRLS